MQKHRLVVAAALSVLTACGGNYSNEDIEFQSAVPAREQLEPIVAAQRTAASAEYYRLTSVVAETYGGIVVGVAKILNRVRRHPATTRKLGERTWGPFDDEVRRNFQVRVRMKREPADDEQPLRFRYDIELAPKGTTAPSDAWVAFISGWFDPATGLREGQGRIFLNIDALRTRGYPEGENVATLRTLELDYNVTASSRELRARQINLGPAEAREANLFYQQAGDGSGLMRFDVTANDNNPFVDRYEMVSAWQANAAGRAELLVLEGAAKGRSGTDCWDTTTVATFSQRDWAPNMTQGDPATCVLPPLR